METNRHSRYSGGAYSTNKLEGNSYRAMKNRCLSPKYRYYHRYGGRGITICDRWLGSSGFRNFLEDMGKKPTPAHSLDRIDNDKNYEPNNCRWATQSEQVRNSAKMHYETIDGVRDTIANHIKRYGINHNTYYDRVTTLGWTIERALKTPPTQPYYGARL